MSSRHQTYFELRESLAQPGCVVCRLSARSVRRYLETLSFESVNDYGVRAQLREARGFCNRHAWQLLDDVRDPFGAGIIYRDVLHHCADLVDSGRIDRLAPVRQCPGCTAQSLAAARYVDVLSEHLGEHDLVEKLASSGGLCWPHFALAVARGGRGITRLAKSELDVLLSVGGGTAQPSHIAGQRPPAPGVRAGTASPRRSPDEVVGDPLIAVAVGLPGVRGTTIGDVEARDWGGGPLADASDDAAFDRSPGAEGCPACHSAGLAVDAAIARIATVPAMPLELCAPHAWRAVEHVGAEPVRARLAPGVEHLAERVWASLADLARAAPFVLGPFTFSSPARRRLAGELSLRLAVGRGCAVCAAQASFEEADVPRHRSRPLCRPHLLLAHRFGVADARASTAAWRAIVADLDEYIRKNDYRFRDEPRGDEQRSPWRAVALVAADRGRR